MSLKTLAPLTKIKSNNDEIGIIIKSLNDFIIKFHGHSKQ